MRCPYCNSDSDKVVDSRESRDGNAIRRRRECIACTRRFTTFERGEDVRQMIIKKDGRREPFDRQKILNGVVKACEKRPIPTEEIEALADRIEHKLLERGEKEVSGQDVGEMVITELRALDDVAYVRFASVYRSFKDVNEFMKELEQVMHERSVKG